MVGCASVGDIAKITIKKEIITDDGLEKNDKIRLCATISVE